MQNLFYVPPHRVQDSHPRTAGVRSVIKRGAPARLDMTPYHPAYAPVPIDAGTAPDVTPAPARGLRFWIGERLIAWGNALTHHTKYPLGQSAA